MIFILITAYLFPIWTLAIPLIFVLLFNVVNPETFNAERNVALLWYNDGPLTFNELTVVIEYIVSIIVVVPSIFKFPLILTSFKYVYYLHLGFHILLHYSLMW